MATIKAYSDLEQSRKLVEILPLESADMIWVLANPDLPMIRAIAYEDSEKSKYYEILPAWSLAALLDVLPYPYIEQNYKGKWTCSVEHGNTTYLWEDSNPVDACVAMIEKLNELKLL